VSDKELAQIAKRHNWVHEVDEYYDKKSKENKKGLPDPDGLDAGIPCVELDNDDIVQRLKDKEEEVNGLNEQYEKMRLEFEAYKKQFPAPEVPKQSKKPVVRVIEDSDEESESSKPPPTPPTPPPPQKPAKAKSIISILDDSSDEEGEVKSKPINTKEHKIMKALECDSLGFLD
jgi:hypothetical protein